MRPIPYPKGTIMSDNFNYNVEAATANERLAFERGAAVAAGAYQEKIQTLQAQNRTLVYITAGTLLYTNRRNIRDAADNAILKVQKKFKDRKEKNR